MSADRVHPSRKGAELHDEIARHLVDSGKLIEAGWVAYRAAAVDKDASTLQVRDLKWAFMAGAQHLFGSISGLVEADDMPTENDLRRLNLIHIELQLFAAELERRFLPHGNG